MKAVLNIKKEKYDEMMDIIISICKSTSNNSGGGKFYPHDGYDVCYEDNNGGKYFFRPNEITYEGTLAAFNIGGEYFIATPTGILLNHKSDAPKWIRGEWTLIEHPRLYMGIWEL